MSPRKRAVPGVGFGTSYGRKLVTAFDEDTFEEIRSIALRRGCAMAVVIRELVQFGLIDLEDTA